MFKTYDHLLERLLKEPPIYIEDDVAGSGCCAVCGKRAALGRCPSCGLLTHVSCVPPLHPGGVPECPRCKRSEVKTADLEASEAWSFGQLKKPKFEKGALFPDPVGRERGLDPRSPYSAWHRPSDAEAKQAGFEDAKEWYAYSAGGALVPPAVLERNLEQFFDGFSEERIP